MNNEHHNCQPSIADRRILLQYQAEPIISLEAFRYKNERAKIFTLTGVPMAGVKPNLNK